MSRRSPFLAGAVTVLLAFPSLAVAQADDALQGAWLLDEVEPVGEEVNTDPQPGLIIFTETHYSFMVVASDSVRADLPEEPSDAELAESYDPFIANSGRYEVQGDTIITRAYVAKYPNYMHAFPDNVASYRYRIEDDRLILSHYGFPEDGFESTWQRVEGTEFPY